MFVHANSRIQDALRQVSLSSRHQEPLPRRGHARGGPTPNCRPWRLRQGTSESALGHRLLLQELAFNTLSVGFVVGNLCVDFLFVCEIVGKSRVHSGGCEMLVLADDVFSAV